MADLGPKKITVDGTSTEEFSQTEKAVQEDRDAAATTLKASGGGWKNTLRMGRAKPANPAD